MSQTIIKIENISKQYRLGNISTGTVSRDLERWLARIRGKEDPFLKIGQENILNRKKKKKTETTVPAIQTADPGSSDAQKSLSDFVWALKDISFEVNQGDTLGIIGYNGAGKSTLLKILSQITAPTTGSIKIKGRMASLLEVGTGFHPELTGRENIFLNGAILGMTKAEIKKKFDEIIDFSGVEQYVDTPVKRYSSGMYVRLAFAVAAHLEPEILVVDEVLAVGDADFQKKCLRKMKDVSINEGRTVLFVSHNMAAVQKLCTRGLILLNGQMEFSGPIQQVIDRYINSNDDSMAVWSVPLGNDTDKSKGYAYKLQIEDLNGNLLNEVPVGTPWQIRISFTICSKVNYFILAIGFRNMLDVNIRTIWSPRTDLDEGNYEMVFIEDKLIFGEGKMKISIDLSSYEKSIHYVEDFAFINFTAINNSIIDERIIRTNLGTILNPMETKIIKI